jgi:hypothetical protein
MRLRTQCSRSLGMYAPRNRFLDELERSEDRAQALHERRYLAQLLSHPECEDPDHPGCPGCVDDGPED